MTELQLYEQANGDCGVCGADSEGSFYWTPLPDDVWEIIRPHLLPLFGEEDRIQNVLFFPAHSTPFCGAACATKYNEVNYVDDV